MKHTSILLLLLAFVGLAGCQQKPEPQEVFNEQKSGVVLICNQYYYDITLNNGNHIYFSGLDEDGDIVNLTGDLDEIKSNMSMLNGTGFFVDNYGRILTNRHVVAPEVNKEQVRNNINLILSGYAGYIEALQDSMNQRYSAIQDYAQQTVYQDEYGNSYTTLTDNDIAELRQEVSDLKAQYEEAENVKNEVKRNIMNYNFNIKLHTEFGIAYDNSIIKSWADFLKNPCNLLRVSDDVNSDLALLQLKSKTTPTGKYIYNVDQQLAETSDQLQINQPVYMIGFNHGVALANTNNGIRAQFTTGTITQQPDGNRMIYSIPAMQGSSGAPIVDEYGHLVAVNFAGSNGSDNFNFGIPILRVLTFLK